MGTMSRLEAGIIFFFILFLAVFFFDYFFVKRRYLKRLNGKKKKKKNKNNELTEIVYLVNKFKLDKSRLPLNKLCLVFSLINAFIISLVAVLVLLIDTYIILQLVIGFVLLIALIYAIYELLGRYLERKGYGKNGK